MHVSEKHILFKLYFMNSYLVTGSISPNSTSSFILWILGKLFEMISQHALPLTHLMQNLKLYSKIISVLYE